MNGLRARRALQLASLALLVSLAVVSLLHAQPSAPVAGAPPPRAIAAEPIWDAGTVASATRVEHEFTIRNDGTDTLFLREVRPACGCTVVSFDPTVAPRASGRVHVAVDTSAFRGPIAKDVMVFTSDPGNPQIQLIVRAVVRPPVDALPGYYRFRHVQGQPAETVTQTVWSDRPDFTVTGATSPLPQVTVAVRPAAPAERRPDGSDRQWGVAATLKNDAAVGPLTGDVVVSTNDPRQPTLAIPLVGDVRPVISLVPPVVDFGAFAAGEPRRASILITNNGVDGLQVLGVDTDVRGLTAKLQPREPGKRWDVVLTLAADAPKGPLAGTVRVRTSAPQEPLVEARVLGTVR